MNNLDKKDWRTELENKFKIARIRKEEIDEIIMEKFISELLEEREEERHEYGLDQYAMGQAEGMEYKRAKDRDTLIEKMKEKSANLPINIERQGGLYAQGMHAGLDLAIDIAIMSNK